MTGVYKKAEKRVENEEMPLSFASDKAWGTRAQDKSLSEWTWVMLNLNFMSGFPELRQVDTRFTGGNDSRLRAEAQNLCRINSYVFLLDMTAVTVI